MLSIEAVITDPNLDAIEKLNKVYYQSGNYKVENIEFILVMTEALYSEDNLLLRYKFQRKSIEDFVVSLGEPNCSANLASLETNTGWSIGPQLKSPTNAPVEVSTAGTTPDKSISLTVMFGDAN